MHKLSISTCGVNCILLSYYELMLFNYRIKNVKFVQLEVSPVGKVSRELSQEVPYLCVLQ
jgi:hypothetical protein